METRRAFLKKSMLLSGAAGISGIIPASVQRAMAINPPEGSTFLDAEHVVILMQENRSFDHCFGTLRGVRGYNDPRAITLPDKNPAWLQTNKAGETYAPFALNMRGTKATWMGDTPHSRSSQVDANNLGKYDKWIDAKQDNNYPGVPLTMGYYTRDDLPFNYALADAFTVCDQHFCSAMTSTWPNRLFMWLGTVRPKKKGSSKAYIRNDIPYGEAHWKTFPERLEENGISWKVYQNDITSGGGYEGEERSWLSNFGCNQLENFSQYGVRFSPKYIRSLEKRRESLSTEIKGLESKLRSLSSSDRGYDKTQKDLSKKKEVLESTKEELLKWSQENYDRLPEAARNLYRKAFSTNEADPDYHSLTKLTYAENGTERELTVPKGDVLYQFREDALNGKLPAVSWLVPPQNFSDHPSAPWYGSWYVSEILDILTRNPELWKKTIFILTYDENDGYFDHVPPFTPPDPEDPATGKCSAGLNVSGAEFIRRENELRDGISQKAAREGPVGLGFRVPLVIASPWSRGGKVCSEVFDHTSSLQFLEKFLNGKFGVNIHESNISNWRRTVCGDLTSAFTHYTREKTAQLPFLSKDPFLETIYNTKFKKEPSTYKRLSEEEIAQINRDPASAPLMPRQEPGTRPSCPLPYELYANGRLSKDKKSIEMALKAGNEVFSQGAAGSPFKVYAPGSYLAPAAEKKGEKIFETVRVWDYAVSAGDRLTETWPLEAFEDENYHLRVYGPNGFFREFSGNAGDPALTVDCGYQRNKFRKNVLSGNVELKISNLSPEQASTIVITDNAYHSKPVTREIAAGETAGIVLDLEKSFGWYDFTVSTREHPAFAGRYAGRVETGKVGCSDPSMA